MQDRFVAQAMVETDTDRQGARLELTFAGTNGERRTLSIPRQLARDLAAVLASLVADDGACARTELTKLPQRWALGAAAHEKLVLLRFDDDPPYGLDLEVARRLCQEFRQQILDVERAKVPALQ
jgi:hypothetical protein